MKKYWLIGGLVSILLSGCAQKEHPKAIPSSGSSQAVEDTSSSHEVEKVDPKADQLNELMDAISNEDAEKVKELLQAGADPNAKDDLGNSPLITAAQYGNGEVAQVLLDAGADPNVKDSLGVTPLQMAKENGYAELADLLMQKGAKE